MKTKIDINIINTFIDDGCIGNPAGIVYTIDKLSKKQMQDLAIKAKQPMTAFVYFHSNVPWHYNIRFYDKTGRESHICGHATIAASYQLLITNLKLNNKTITFHLNPKLSSIKTIEAIPVINKVLLMLPETPAKCVSNNKIIEIFAEALRVFPENILSIGYSKEIRDYVVILDSALCLIQLNPDFDRLLQLAKNTVFKHEGLMVSAKCMRSNDFVHRVFLPITGVNEDIACGSSNCTLIPYWINEMEYPEKDDYEVLFPLGLDNSEFGGKQTIKYNKGIVEILGKVSKIKTYEITY